MVFVLLLILAVGVTVGIRAKYRTEVEMEGEVQFTAELADSITLTEHEIKKNADGSYSLTEKVSTTGENEYTVMPGVDLPKDPAFTIENKSNIPAYLYVEVVESDSFPDTVTYTLLPEWEALNITGPKEGTVYVYEGDFINGEPIQILENNVLTVSQNYQGTAFELDFYGYMAQEIDGKTREGIFTTCFKTMP